MFRKHTKPLANYTLNAEGELEASKVRLYPCNEYKNATYEVEFTQENIGIVLETNFDDTKTVIGKIKPTPFENVVKRMVRVGDILMCVNGKDVLNEEFEDVYAYIKMLKMGAIGVRLKFLNPMKSTLEEYLRVMKERRTLKKDFFGFVRTLEYIMEERKVMEKNAELNEERDEDWREFIDSIGGFEGLMERGDEDDPAYLDQRDMIRRGVPNYMRARVWMRTSGCEVLQALAPKDYYATLVKRCKTELPGSVKDEVEKDVPRTFPNHAFFKGQGADYLRRVLQAHALHNSNVGYCQSLNFIAGTLLLFVEEEQAFWLLVTITQHIMPMKYYSPDMSDMYTDQNVLAHVIKSRIPKVGEQFDRMQLQISFVAVPWFMCLFVTTLRMEVALRAWDILFNEGSFTLFRLTVALLKINESKILACKDGGEVLTLMRTAGQSIHDPEYLVNRTFRLMSFNSMLDDANILADTISRNMEEGAVAFVEGMESGAKAAQAAADATAKAAQAGANVVAKGFMGMINRIRTASTSKDGKNMSTLDVIDAPAEDDAMEEAIKAIRRKSVILREHVLENWKHGKAPPGMIGEVAKKDDSPSIAPDAEKEKVESASLDGEADDKGSLSSAGESSSEKGEQLDRTPQHYADFTDAELTQWRKRFSGQLPLGALSLDKEEEEEHHQDKSLVPKIFRHSIHHSHTPERLPEAFKQYFSDPFSPPTPVLSVAEEPRRKRTDSDSSTLSTSSATSGNGSPDKKPIKGRRGSFLHRLSLKQSPASSIGTPATTSPTVPDAGETPPPAVSIMAAFASVSAESPAPASPAPINVASEASPVTEAPVAMKMKGSSITPRPPPPLPESEKVRETVAAPPISSATPERRTSSSREKLRPPSLQETQKVVSEKLAGSPDSENSPDAMPRRPSLSARLAARRKSNSALPSEPISEEISKSKPKIVRRRSLLTTTASSPHVKK